MTVRVRKLAKELKRTPVHLIGVLHALGFDKYRSPEDMLPDLIEQRLRWAIRNGTQPVEVEVERERKEAPRTALAAGAMASIVPGVVRQVDERFVKADVPRVVVAPRPQAVRESAPTSEARPAADPAVAEAERRAHEARKQAMDAERSALDAERQAFAAERAAFAAEKAAWSSHRDHSPRRSFADVLTERGLVGADEAERAVRALAEARRVPELLPFLEVSDPNGLIRWLRDVLVLVDGPPPPALSSEALVTVAPDRAEFPGAATWARLASQLSERLLLQGARRVVIVGGPTRGHRLLRMGMDPRIDLRFRPAHRVSAADAEADVQRTDAVALWNVDTDPAADAVYGSGRALVARVHADGIRGFVEEWSRALTR